MKSRQIVFDIPRLKDERYSTRAIVKRSGIGRDTVIDHRRDR